ncbi:hypothetical protein [Acetobacter orientalis]|nr:hypothetical protein [Acetobacter orientalis]
MRINRSKVATTLILGISLAGCAEPEPVLQAVTVFYAPQHDIYLPTGKVFDTDAGEIAASSDGISNTTIHSEPRFIRICDAGQHSCQNGILSYTLTANVIGRQNNGIEIMGAFTTVISDRNSMKDFNGSTLYSAILDKTASPLPYKEMKVPFHQTIKLGEQIKLEGLDESSVSLSLRNQPIFRNGKQVQ